MTAITTTPVSTDLSADEGRLVSFFNGAMIVMTGLVLVAASVAMF